MVSFKESPNLLAHMLIFVYPNVKDSAKLGMSDLNPLVNLWGKKNLMEYSRVQLN